MVEDDLSLPPFSTPPAVVGPNVQVWFTEPAGMVSWLPPGAEFSLDDGKVLSSTTALLRKIPAKQWLFMHDFFNGTGVKSAARQEVVNWGKTWKSSEILIRLSIRPDAPIFARMTVDIGLMAMRVIGVDIEVQENIRPNIKAEKMVPLSPSQLRYYRALVDADTAKSS